ncbi:MAG: L-lactate dehydrogenase [Bacilli bacterium]|nr:L-lactate dehydrogenase [Bacilli bacterium]
MKKVVVVGCGNVGMAYVNNLINSKGLVDEIVLIDKEDDRLIGEAMDLSHAAVGNNSNTKIKHGSYKDCLDADIVVITAGKNQAVGQNRLTLVNDNKVIVRDIVRESIINGFSGVFLIATNPVDIMCYVAKETANYPSNKIIGTGTLLDTARVKYLLSQKIKVNTENIHAYVLGEHGDSSFVVWSKSTIGMVPIKETITNDDLDAIENEVRQIGYRILNKKGYTNYGEAMCLLKITKAILKDENIILNVSSPYEEIYISMPSVISKDGIKGTMKINFDEEESLEFEHSKDVIRNAIRSMEE